MTGRVAELQAKRAVVLTDDGGRWKVPYGMLAVKKCPRSECTLAEIEELAASLISEHRRSGLSGRWSFGFDLSTTRGGVCRFEPRRIDLSVSFCLRATRAEVRDCLLHEIAHAIVGLEHGHDAVWRAKAREIGGTANRCHAVSHTEARWIGECACGAKHQRHRLRQRVMTGTVCRSCGSKVEWRLNTLG